MLHNSLLDQSLDRYSFAPSEVSIEDESEYQGINFNSDISIKDFELGLKKPKSKWSSLGKNITPKLKVLESEPDFTNENTKLALQKVKDFDFTIYNFEVEQGIEIKELGPVLLPNEAVYIGQWNQYAQRYGKGKLK